jgi:hypothetical protein
MYYDNVTPANNGEALRNILIRDLSIANRAQMGALVLEGDYYYLIGLSWGEYGVYAQRAASVDAEYITMFRCHCEGYGGGYVGTEFPNISLGTSGGGVIGWGITDNGSSGNNGMMYQCSFEKAIPTYPANPSGEFKDININCKYSSFVSNVFYNSGGSQLGNGWNTYGITWEDNDMHRDRDFTSGGIESPGADYGSGEAMLGFKKVNLTASSSSADMIRVWGNRISGARLVSAGLDPGGPDTGFVFVMSAVYNRNFIDFRWNIIEDSKSAVFRLVSPGTGTTGSLSVVRNIGYNIRGPSTNYSGWFHNRYDKTEMYLNTIKDCTSTYTYTFYTVDDIDVFDGIGNLNINTSLISSSEKLIGTSEIGYNVWADSTGTVNIGYGGDVTTTEALLADMGDFKYKWYKWYASPESRTIPGIVPTSASLASILTITPLTGDDQVGTKTGTGVDDLF